MEKRVSGIFINSNSSNQTQNPSPRHNFTQRTAVGGLGIPPKNGAYRIGCRGFYPSGLKVKSIEAYIVSDVLIHSPAKIQAKFPSYAKCMANT
jgi:hypothetical protein